MVGIKVEAQGLEEVKEKLQELLVHTTNIRPMLSKAGQIMVSGVTENFENEGRPDKWKRRSINTNLAYGNKNYDSFLSTKRGLGLSSRAETKKRSKNALENKKESILLEAAGGRILQRSGRLKQSISFVADNRTVIVGSALPYARIHQLGGTIKPKGKALCIPLGGGKIILVKKVVIPARPYLNVTRKETDKIVTEALGYLKEGIE